MPKGAKTAQFDQIHKEAIRKEETAKIEWEKNWTWLMDEYMLEKILISSLSDHLSRINGHFKTQKVISDLKSCYIKNTLY